jgi:hypothetical protein
MNARALGFVSLLGAAVAASGLALAAEARTYVSGGYFLTIDGVKTGFLKSTSGGGISAQVINEAQGAGPYVSKHIGQPRYEPLTMNLGFSNTKAIYEWIGASWSATAQRKSVTIDDLDSSLQPRSTRAYTGCLIAETTIPPLDGSSKEPAYMSVKLDCESMRATQASTTAQKVTGEFGKNEQKVFLPSNFKLQIDGLDCTRVSKVDSFTVKRAVVPEVTGQGRDSTKQPGRVDVPNIKVTLSEVGSASWKQWFDDFVVKGNNDSKKEKSGTLTLFTPNLQKALATIRFSNIGIFRLESAPVTGSDSTPKVTAELYVESMAFDYSKDVVN